MKSKLEYNPSTLSVQPSPAPPAALSATKQPKQQLRESQPSPLAQVQEAPTDTIRHQQLETKRPSGERVSEHTADSSQGPKWLGDAHNITEQPSRSPSPSPDSATAHSHEHTLDEDSALDENDSPDTFNVPPEFLNRLATFPLFNKAPKSFHSKVASKLTLMQYHPQEYIIKKGDPSKSMYWIMKGTVTVTSTDGESIYAELAPGSFFGEIGILFNRPRTATVVARTRVLVGVLTASTLNLVLKNYPLIERRIRDEAQERLAMLDKKKKYDLPNLISNITNNDVGSHQKGTSSTATTTSISASVEDSPVGSSLIQSGIHASALANSHSFHPGPSIPPMTHSPSPLSSLRKSDNVDASVSIQEFIMNIPMFHNLPAHLIHQVALEVEPLNLSAYQYVFHKGDVNSDIYFIINGEVEVIDLLEDPNSSRELENILGRLNSGSYFGEMSFLNSLTDGENVPRRSASIRTISSVELMVVKSDRLKSLCDKFPFIAEDMRRTANERNMINSSIRKVSLEKTRLSINYLINANAGCCEPKEMPPLAESLNSTKPAESSSLTVLSPAQTATPERETLLVHPQSQRLDSTPLFSPDWDFFQSRLTSVASAATASSQFSSRPQNSRSISPATESGASPDSDTASDNQNKRRRQSQAKFDDFEYPVNLNLPPSNPVPPSLNNFQTLQGSVSGGTGSGRSSVFQYLPHNKRIRLASVSGRSRRRSSILSNNGPLPDRLLVKVFEFLTLPELMKLRVMSKRWRQLLYAAPNLFKTLRLTPWSNSIDDKAMINITNFVGSRPQVIDLSNCFHITDEGFTYMVNEIGISGKIKTLKMKSIWEVSAMAIMDLTVPSVGQYLEEIDLSNCRKVRDNVMERLIGWGPPNGKADNMPMSSQEDDLDFDMEQIGCKNLRILNVGYCKHLSDNFMFHIANHASHRIESLDLTRCTTITDKGFQYWSYRSFPNLKKLSLKDCTFLTDKAIIALANAAPNLEILDLNFCCALSDVAIEMLCLGCPNIRELDLSFCGSAVSDSSLVAISLHLKSLEKLILRGCIRVTRAGVDAVLSGCSPLSYLNISQCKNAHIYPGSIPAQKLNVNPQTKSAFVTSGPFQDIIEIVI